MARILKQKDYFSGSIRHVGVTATIEENEFEHYPCKIILFGYINQSKHSVMLEIGCDEKEWQDVFERVNAEFCLKWIKQQHDLFADTVVPAMWDLLNAPIEE